MDETPANAPRLRLVQPATRVWDLAHFESRVADYVAGDLSEEENERFEEAMLGNPEWAELVEAEQMLRDGIRALATTEPQLFEAPVNPAVIPLVAAADGHARRRRWVSGLAMAATVTFAALLVNARMQIHDLQSALGAAQSPSASVEFIRLDEMRGPGASDTLKHTLSSQLSTVVLEIPAGPSPLPAYRLRLLHAGRIVWDLSPAKPNDEGFLMISVPANTLAAGDYSAVLSAPDASAQPLASYAFNLSAN